MKYYGRVQRIWDILDDVGKMKYFGWGHRKWDILVGQRNEEISDGPEKWYISDKAREEEIF